MNVLLTSSCNLIVILNAAEEFTPTLHYALIVLMFSFLFLIICIAIGCVYGHFPADRYWLLGQYPPC